MTFDKIKTDIMDLSAEMAMSIIKHMPISVFIDEKQVDIDGIEKTIDGVEIKINTPFYYHEENKTTVATDIEREEETTSVDLDGLKLILNAYVKKAGKAKAFELVEQYANGSKNPADIPKKHYIDVIRATEGVELEIDGEAA